MTWEVVHVHRLRCPHAIYANGGDCVRTVLGTVQATGRASVHRLAQKRFANCPNAPLDGIDIIFVRPIRSS